MPRIQPERAGQAFLTRGKGLVESTTELTVRGLHDALEVFAQRGVLDAHYRSHLDARPDLAEIALAAAEIAANLLAQHPELNRRAAVHVALMKDDPSPRRRASVRRRPGRLRRMSSPRFVVVDNEAVQALHPELPSSTASE